MRAYLIAIALLVAILGSIGGYKFLQIQELMNTDFSPPPVTVAAGTAQTDSWAQYLQAVGTIRALRGVDLSSETSGEITEINFESGDQISSGQLLLVLNDDVEQASRENQAASLELAQVLFERDSELVKKNSVSQTQYDQSKADLSRAKAQLAETEARLRNKRIHAPFAGTIGIRLVELGDYISPGTIIATLQDRSELEVDFTLPARYAPLLRAGQGIAVSVDAFPKRRFPARIKAVDARIDPSTRNILVRATLLKQDVLIPGMFAALRIDLENKRPVVIVPETAVTYSLQGNLVHVVTTAEDGGLTAVANVVEVGEVRNGRSAILSGLEGGERIVIAGQNKLYRGVKILIDEDVQL